MSFPISISEQGITATPRRSHYAVVSVEHPVVRSVTGVEIRNGDRSNTRGKVFGNEMKPNRRAPKASKRNYPSIVACSTRPGAWEHPCSYKSFVAKAKVYYAPVRKEWKLYKVTSTLTVSGGICRVSVGLFRSVLIPRMMVHKLADYAWNK